MQVQVSDEAKNAAQWNLSLPQAVVKPDLFQTVSYDPTKLRNKKYTATLNPRNEICTELCAGRLTRFQFLSRSQR